MLKPKDIVQNIIDSANKSSIIKYIPEVFEEYKLDGIGRTAK